MLSAAIIRLEVRSRSVPRYELRSLYDPDRKTFIYDLESYDRVIVMTDSALVSLKGLETLTYALRMKNENITVIRWC